MPRFAITAIVFASRLTVDMACRKLRKELRKPVNAKFLDLVEINVVELKEVDRDG